MAANEERKPDGDLVGLPANADDLVEAVARRVVELLRGESSAPQFVTAAELARLLSLERGWVYAHANELGAIRLGAGPRSRLRFDVARAAAALEEGRDPLQQKPTLRPRRGRPRKTRLPAGVAPLRGRKERK
jgi:hypothetical protein